MALQGSYRKHKPVRVSFPAQGRTHQSFKEECDVNNVVKRFEKTGFLPNSRGPGQFGDFSSNLDYREALQTVMDAQDMFEQVPAKIRREFDNDPAQFVAFCDDPDNEDQLIDWGLMNKPPPGEVDPMTEQDTPPDEAPPRQKKKEAPKPPESAG